jgi:hypothetical protein
MRHHKEDTEVVYLVSCFLYRLGIKSEIGLKVVSSLRSVLSSPPPLTPTRDLWKRFSSEMNLKPKSSPGDARRLQR